MTSQIPITIGGRLHASTEKCNTKIKDLDDRKIDLHNIADHHTLDLSRPFERAIMLKILNVTSCNTSMSLEKCTITHPTSGHEQHIKFKRNLTDDKYNALSQDMKDEVANLKRVVEIAQNESLAELLFLEHDADSSGGLDADEVEALVKSLGLTISRETIELVIHTFDIDGGGVLEMTEFLEFIRSQKADAIARIRELTESFVITSTKNPTTRYIPPTVGILTVLVGDAYMAKGATVVSSEDHGNIMNIARNAKEGQRQIIEFGIKGSKLRAKEAFAIYQFMSTEIRSPTVVLEKLLPSIINPTEARIFMQRTVQNDPKVLKRLRQTMGGAFNAILGQFDGWYSLDLSHEYDRICLAKLLEQSQSNKEKMMEASCFGYGITGDVSQLGDWSSFRNVVIDGKPGMITTEMYNPMAKKGTLHFDFSGADKPDEKVSILSDQRVVNCLILHGIVTSAGKGQTLIHLNQMKKECAKNFRGDGFFNNNLKEERAKEIQMFMLYFFENLSKRPQFVRRGQIIEESNLAQAADTQEVLLNVPKDVVRQEDVDGISSSDEDDNADDDDDDMYDNSPRNSFMGGTSITKASPPTRRKNKNMVANTVDKVALAEKLKSSIVMLKDQKTLDDKSGRSASARELTDEISYLKQNPNKTSKYIACWKIVNLVYEIFKNSWLRCRHVAVILTHFFQGHIKRSRHFGSYRVELVVLLFHRLIDVQNFDVIAKRLLPAEIACCYCRIGYLKLFNPMKPEGSHFLNIANREERILTKLIGALSTLEPGENWIDETFQWELEMDPIPGWVLTQSWMTDEGMPPRGFLYVNYYSGEGKKLQGTQPNIAVRKSLFHLVGIKEQDLFWDESNHVFEKQTIDTECGKREVMRIVDSIYTKPEGDKCAMDCRSLWEVLLAPSHSTSARIARGEKVLAVFESIQLQTGKNPFNLHVVNVPRKKKKEKIDPTAQRNTRVGTRMGTMAVTERRQTKRMTVSKSRTKSITSES